MGATPRDAAAAPVERLAGCPSAERSAALLTGASASVPPLGGRISYRQRRAVVERRGANGLEARVAEEQAATSLRQSGLGCERRNIALDRQLFYTYEDVPGVNQRLRQPGDMQCTRTPQRMLTNYSNR